MKNAYIALVAFGSAIALVGTATPALAKTTPRTISETMVIELADLNLASAKGRKVLERRINQAAKKVCGLDEARTGTRLKSRDAQICYREAKAKATKQFAALIEKQRLGG